MKTLWTVKKLLVGETWLLPLGLAALVAAAGLVIRPLLHGAWTHLGGFILLAGVLGLVLASVARSARADKGGSARAPSGT
jgi:uncharacterized membrane protein